MNIFFSWITRLFSSLLSKERCMNKLSLSVAVAFYVAFCPFVGLHTMLVFLLSWLFSLNVALVLTLSMVIHNPWTMIPVYGAGYFVGDALLSWLSISHHAANPAWFAWCNNWFVSYSGGNGFSFWAFMLGGNIVGLALAIFSYVVMRCGTHFFKKRSIQHVMQSVKESPQKVITSLKEKTQPLVVTIKQRACSKATYEANSSK